MPMFRIRSERTVAPMAVDPEQEGTIVGDVEELLAGKVPSYLLVILDLAKQGFSSVMGKLAQGETAEEIAAPYALQVFGFLELALKDALAKKDIAQVRADFDKRILSIVEDIELGPAS
jgi:hypothetical protein